jgi:hypothetical protein
MFELVRRGRNTIARYSALQQYDDSSASEAEEDAIATAPPPRRAQAVPYTPMHANTRQVRRRQADNAAAASTGSCTIVGFIVSCAGVIFLCTIGRMLAGDTPYIMLEAPEANSTFAGAVFGGAAMYFLSMCYTGYTLCQGWMQRRSPLMDPP